MSLAGLLLRAALVVCVLGGCSVKEDRLECPAWVCFEAYGGTVPDGDWSTMRLFAFRDGACVLDREYPLSDFLSGNLVVSVYPGPVHFAGVLGWPAGQVTDGVLRIPEGEQCSEAWGFDEPYVVKVDDEMRFTESLRALYANVFIRVVGRGEDYPWDLVMEGTVDGYTLASLEPHRGPFSVSPVQEGVEDFVVRVPRQVDGSLELALYGREMSTKAGEGGKVYALPVGEIVGEGGYDWGADVLPDIHITVDFASLTVLIRVEDWIRVLILDASGHYTI